MSALHTIPWFTFSPRSCSRYYFDELIALPSSYHLSAPLLLRRCAAVLISLGDYVVGVSIDFVENGPVILISLGDHVVSVSIDFVENGPVVLISLGDHVVGVSIDFVENGTSTAIPLVGSSVQETTFDTITIRRCVLLLVWSLK